MSFIIFCMPSIIPAPLVVEPGIDGELCREFCSGPGLPIRAASGLAASRVGLFGVLLIGGLLDGILLDGVVLGAATG
ncbi:hypothetical protein [Methylotenera mobilis]|uniref:hypothetical protein n=1 Tax=Methylotenera mobilis TaxID=359408 RepID=UPI0018DEEA45|nr:hypothetical protein [Methylotenera mobilis]